MTDDDVNDFLEHFGVKGMRWGVRNEKETSGGQSDFQKDLAKHPPKPLTREQQENVRKSAKKFEAQRDDGPDEDSKGWRPTKKQVITIGVGAAAAAAIIGGGIAYKHYAGSGAKPFSLEQYKKFANPIGEDVGWLKTYSGKHMSVEDYKGITATSVGRVWGSRSYITKASFDQKETVFEKGHEFFRVSHRDETGFKPITYMLHSKDELARYQLAWKAETTHILGFKAKDSIKVPDLATRLEATRRAMRESGMKRITPEQVIQRYSANSGGDWQTGLGANIVKHLKQMGFHALVDDMDAGVYGEMPLVLMDPSRMGDKVNLSSKITSESLKPILTNITNRR